MNIKRCRTIAIQVIALSLFGFIAFMLGYKYSTTRSGIEMEQQSSQIESVQEDPNSLTERNEDGTRIVWIKNEDGRFLNQYRYAANGSLLRRAMYRMNPSGYPLSCKIFDGDKNELFKGSYGYRKEDGKLVEERFFDSTQKRLNEEGYELPVLRILHFVEKETGLPKCMPIDLVDINFPVDFLGGFKNPFQNR